MSEMTGSLSSFGIPSLGEMLSLPGWFPNYQSMLRFVQNQFAQITTGWETANVFELILALALLWSIPVGILYEKLTGNDWPLR